MPLYLGLDSSTQGLKAEIINTETAEIISESVNFGQELPEYKSPSGVLDNPDPLVCHANPMMWLAALDLLLEKLVKNGAPLGDIEGISGSGQQHGSVYLNNSFFDIVSNLDPAEKLPEQLSPALSRTTSPIWMDRSTAVECAELNEKFGDQIQLKTGSPAIERFTVPQIRKFAKTEPEAYANTARIHLVSSFMASVLVGGDAPIDFGDGAGMNLLNLKTLTWDKDIASFTAPGLLEKLPAVKPSNTIAGHLCPYFTKYGFKAGIPVAAWSGDNPCSLIGTGAAEAGVAVISLGTSDTFFAAMSDFKTDPEGFGHVFGNPAGGFMSLICFTNGSLAREKIKEECGASWAEFDSAPLDSEPGNNGNMILPYFAPESTPLVLQPGAKYSGSDEFCSGRAPVSVKSRAIFESQALTMKLHSAWMGEKFTRIRITGGASKSKAFRQILADVFQAQIEQISISDSAGLGAALRAANAIGAIPFAEIFKKFSATAEIVYPDEKTAMVYDDLLKKYAELEQNYR
jgi:xylulokinase